jgi:hypothetical protein
MKMPVEGCSLSLFLAFAREKEALADKARKRAESLMGEKVESSRLSFPVAASWSCEKGCLAVVKQEEMVLLGLYFTSLPPSAEPPGGQGDDTEAPVKEEMLEPRVLMERAVREMETRYGELFEGTAAATLILSSAHLEKSTIGTLQESYEPGVKGGEKLKNLSIFSLKVSSCGDNRELLMQVALLNASTVLLMRLLSGIEDYYCEIVEEKNYLEGETFKVFRGKAGEGPEYLALLEKRIRDLSEKHIKLSLNSAVVEERLEAIKYRSVSVDRRRALLGKVLDREGLRETEALFSAINIDVDTQAALLEKGLRSLQVTLNNAQTAITSMRMEVELFRSAEAGRLQAEIKEAQNLSVSVQGELKNMQHTTLELQKEGVFLQTAAGFIEFILIFYYSLGAWHLINIHGFEKATPTFRFIFGLVMGLSMTGMGHFLTDSIKEKRLNPWLLLCLAVTVIMLVLAWH